MFESISKNDYKLLPSMWKFVFFCSHLVFLAGNINTSQEFRLFSATSCDLMTSKWTSWLNSQTPSITGGNDIEDIDQIREKFNELIACKTVLNLEYSILTQTNDSFGTYETIVNRTGVFCTASLTSKCPDYQVRFCCSKSQKKMFSTCGQTFRQVNWNPFVRIVNGLEAVPHSFPWAVSLEYRKNHDCGGVIIDQYHVLTAAHCLDYEHDLGNYFVRVGAHNRLTSGQLIPVAKSIIHPTYQEHVSTDDIGIIKLATPITFNQEVQPICLVDSILEPALGTTAFVVGWGNTIHQVWNSASPTLRQARLRVIADCSMYKAYDPQRQICVASNGPTDKDHGSCQGDSGGALYFSKDGRWYAGGVVSYAIGCGRVLYPTVYTKTAAYIDWIRSIVGHSFMG